MCWQLQSACAVTCVLHSSLHQREMGILRMCLANSPKTACQCRVSRTRCTSCALQWLMGAIHPSPTEFSLAQTDVRDRMLTVAVEQRADMPELLHCLPYLRHSSSCFICPARSERSRLRLTTVLVPKKQLPGHLRTATCDVMESAAMARMRAVFGVHPPARWLCLR